MWLNFLDQTTIQYTMNEEQLQDKKWIESMMWCDTTVSECNDATIKSGLRAGVIHTHTIKDTIVVTSFVDSRWGVRNLTVGGWGLIFHIDWLTGLVESSLSVEYML